MDEVFKALSDPARRSLLDSLHARNGQNLRELCAGLDMTRQSVSKHLAVLEDAGLVSTVRHGREKAHYLDVAPIDAITDRWISKYTRERIHALADLKTALEQETVETTDFAYTTYIHTTAERLWQALTDPAFTRRYWRVTFRTDWQKGSAMVWEENGREVSDPAQVVLEADRPRRLAYTWHTFTSEWAAHAGVDAETLTALQAERRSKVTFNLEPTGDLVKLTVLHDDFPPESTAREMCQHGWPRLLSDLKTLLEQEESSTPSR